MERRKNGWMNGWMDGWMDGNKSVVPEHIKYYAMKMYGGTEA
jgi:hypothetical protein